MRRNPIRLLVIGYGGATAAAGVVLAFGGGALAALATAWLGGAVLSLAVGAIQTALRADAVGIGDEDATLAEAMRKWEADRTADTATPERASVAER